MTTETKCPVCEAAHALCLSGAQAEAADFIRAAIVQERKAKEKAEADAATLRDKLRAWRDPVCDAIRARISEISEEKWCAGWLIEIEHLVWRDVATGTRNEIDDAAAANLRVLSEIVGGWVHWPQGADGPTFVALDEWTAIHADWLKVRAAEAKEGA